MRWLPLESNPDVINAYIKVLGVGSQWSFCDVYGFDSDLLEMVPKPTLALMLLFPITDKYSERSKAEAEALKERKYSAPEGVYFMEQKIGNACGTIAIIHALANNRDCIQFDKESMFVKFVEKSEGVSARERSEVLEADKDMMEAHETSAQEGQTQAPDRDDKVNLHFVCFIHANGTLYELDGRKPFPIAHGPSSKETFLTDAAKVCRDFIDKEPGNLQFTSMALASSSSN